MPSLFSKQHKDLCLFNPAEQTVTSSVDHDILCPFNAVHLIDREWVCCESKPAVRSVQILPILWCGFGAIKPQFSILCRVNAQMFAKIIVEPFWSCSVKTKVQERVKLLNHTGKRQTWEKKLFSGVRNKEQNASAGRPNNPHSDWCTMLNAAETKSVWEKWMENLTWASQTCSLKYATNEWLHLK